MAPRSQITPEQLEWLITLKSQYYENQAAKTLSEFWPVLDHGWFLRWPEPGVLEAELEPEGHPSRNKAAEALSSRKSYLRNWFHNRNVNKRKAPIKIQPHASNFRSHQPVEVYSRQFYKERVKPQVVSELAGIEKSKGETLELIKQKTKQAFDAEPEEIRQAIFAQANALKIENAARRAQARKSVTEHSPQSYATAIESVAYVLDSVIGDLAKRTGWAFSVMGGGPDPVNAPAVCNARSLLQTANELDSTEGTQISPNLMQGSSVAPRAPDTHADGSRTTHSHLEHPDDMDHIDPQLRPPPAPPPLLSFPSPRPPALYASFTPPIFSSPVVSTQHLALPAPHPSPTHLASPAHIDSASLTHPGSSPTRPVSPIRFASPAPPTPVASPIIPTSRDPLGALVSIVASSPPPSPTYISVQRTTPTPPSPITPPHPSTVTPPQPRALIPEPRPKRAPKPRNRPGVQLTSEIQEAAEKENEKEVETNYLWSKELTKAAKLADARVAKAASTRVAKAAKQAAAKVGKATKTASLQNVPQLDRSQRVRKATSSKEVVSLTEKRKLVEKENER
ncbi:hypothetical protein BDZ94DRAFT_1315811 [Collybia nuda]|uniref:Uncharacterized protein n=1 Tax=Collybia nuda TaxID=64659 RepID=A0A9P5XSL8_9AGAR|nr:hypothetical protein BDZ94DRAFT_1316065 [Collybia nuda]KAF9455802.1 hypothetical protein BDZ94DRAFT_1315811 [Collybia nuda]